MQEKIFQFGIITCRGIEKDSQDTFRVFKNKIGKYSAFIIIGSDIPTFVVEVENQCNKQSSKHFKRQPKIHVFLNGLVFVNQFNENSRGYKK